MTSENNQPQMAEAEYEYPDLTPDFYADTNDMYLGYQQAETEPDLDRFVAPEAEARAEPELDPEPEAEL